MNPVTPSEGLQFLEYGALGLVGLMIVGGLIIVSALMGAGWLVLRWLAHRVFGERGVVTEFVRDGQATNAKIVVALDAITASMHTADARAGQHAADCARTATHVEDIRAAMVDWVHVATVGFTQAGMIDEVAPHLDAIRHRLATQGGGR